VAVHAEGGSLDHGVQVGVRADDHRVLAAQLEADVLDRGGGRGGLHPLPGLDAANERNAFDRTVHEHPPVPLEQPLKVGGVLGDGLGHVHRSSCSPAPRAQSARGVGETVRLFRLNI
jgi:hypothetical protein